MTHAAPFEMPAKTQLRDRCLVAVDQAGYVLVDAPVAFPLPDGSGLQGAVKGDVQSVDDDGITYCFYLRPQADRVLPKWLANLAAASHSIPSVKLYVVAEEPSPEFQRSCRTAGAGLLELTADDSFSHVLEYDDLVPEDAGAHFLAAVNETRRAMEDALNMNLALIQTRIERVSEATHGMPDMLAEAYKASVEREYSVWSRWGDDMSARLDLVFSSRDEAGLQLVARDVARGPVLDSED